MGRIPDLSLIVVTIKVTGMDWLLLGLIDFSAVDPS